MTNRSWEMLWFKTITWYFNYVQLYKILVVYNTTVLEYHFWIVQRFDFYWTINSNDGWSVVPRIYPRLVEREDFWVVSWQSECVVLLRGDAFFAGGTVGFEQSVASSYSHIGEYECELILNVDEDGRIGYGWIEDKRSRRWLGTWRKTDNRTSTWKEPKATRWMRFWATSNRFSSN